MKATLYKKPDGRQEVIDLTNILPEDEKWFTDIGAKISMEETGGEFVIYADIGIVTEDGEPDEAIEFASGRSCEQTMSSLRNQCIAMMKDNK